jgi:hypothetical protein
MVCLLNGSARVRWQTERLVHSGEPHQNEEHRRTKDEPVSQIEREFLNHETAIPHPARIRPTLTGPFSPRPTTQRWPEAALYHYLSTGRPCHHDRPMRKLQIDVQQFFISTAEKKDSRYCMIAEAIGTQYPHLANVQVDTQAIRVTDRKEREQLIFMTPLSVQEAILRFDEGEPVKPFRFQLREPRVRPLKATAARPTGKASGKNPGTRRTRTKAGAFRIGRLRVHGLRAIGRIAKTKNNA